METLTLILIDLGIALFFFLVVVIVNKIINYGVVQTNESLENDYVNVPYYPIHTYSSRLLRAKLLDLETRLDNINRNLSKDKLKPIKYIRKHEI
jgi:hypothetical protein